MFAATRKSSALILSIMCLGVGSACKDSTGPADDEPEVEELVLTFSNGVVATINATGTVSNAPDFVPGRSLSFTAKFRDAADTNYVFVSPAEFELVVTPGTGLLFTRTGPFAGTLTAGTSTGTVPVQFGLLHIEEDHIDFGPFTMNVRVANLGGQ